MDRLDIEITVDALKKVKEHLQEKEIGKAEYIVDILLKGFEDTLSESKKLDPEIKTQLILDLASSGKSRLEIERIVKEVEKIWKVDLMNYSVL